MPVTDELVATLRAQLSGNIDEHRRLLRELDKTVVDNVYTGLIGAAFVEAVERRFADKETTFGDVVQWVGELRAGAPNAADDINPSAAERLIYLALNVDVPVDDLDPSTKLSTQVVLLYAIVAELELDDAELDQFLARARSLADEWTR